MVVVTVESTPTTTKSIATEASNNTVKLSLVCEEETPEQCIVSRTHRRTLSPDKVLFLKVPEPITPPLIHPNPEEVSRKRPALEEPCTTATKKARLIVLAPVASLPAAAVRRTVHFEFEAQKDHHQPAVIKTHVRVFERVEACDVGNIWWSGEEMLEIMSREKSAISVMSFCCDHYTSEVLNLMRMARDKASLPGRATAESASPLWVANSPARGLERDIVQGFKQRKRQVIRKVLESQRVLKAGRHQVTGERAPLELQSQVLSSQYKKWSHPMVRFAQVLAEGDAQVVIDNAAAPLVAH